MLKPEELRIGNYILYNNDDSIGKIDTIYSDSPGVDITFPDESTYISLDQFRGVELTEEWLIKFGFEKFDNAGDYVSESDKYWINPIFPFSINSESKEVDGLAKVKLKHVHSLQNLYFAICGKELTIKE